jgi:hypothetical protein
MVKFWGANLAISKEATTTCAFNRAWLLAILLVMDASDVGSLSAGLESRVILHLDADCFYAQVHPP